jgi:hypothetical protein
VKFTCDNTVVQVTVTNIASCSCRQCT